MVQDSSDGESFVFYILAENFKINSIKGLPAFNSLKEIVSFCLLKEKTYLIRTF